MKGQSAPSNAEQAEAASRIAAINLAGLGFSASDVKVYRERKLDLFDMAYRLFQDVNSTPTEHLLLADTVVIATAHEVDEKKTRVDGFLSATPFTVVRSLKGSRAAGDTVFIPRKSGPLPDHIYKRVSSDIEVTPGKKYLLVLSRNWYEQRVAETAKQAESSFNAIPQLVYEISDNGALLPGPRATLSGETPRDIRSVEADLQSLSGLSSAGGRASEI
ncbi:hypothetical protein [Lysobacter sp. CA199]|uniref:hypothetical protein n=1 Tax=Lysobacter sp. CA199 TaxID=3455608 RepID=UPI003F8D3F90